MVGNIGASAKCFWPSALKNQEIRFEQSALHGCVQRFHHGDIKDIERGTIQRDPSGAVFYAELNRFEMSAHVSRALKIEKLFATKFGRPLFKESLNPFFAILGKITLDLLLDFVAQSQSQFFLLAAKQGFLDGADRQWRSLGDLLRERLCFRF